VSVGLIIFFRTSLVLSRRQLEFEAAYLAQAAYQVSDVLRECQTDLRDLGIDLADEGSAAFRTAVADRRLSAYMQVGGPMRSVIVLDGAGSIVASSAGASFVGYDASARDFTQEALAGRSYVSPVFKGSFSGELLIAVAVPFRIRGGQRGAVVGFLPFAELVRFAESMSRESFGQVSFVDPADGKVITLPAEEPGAVFGALGAIPPANRGFSRSEPDRTLPRSFVGAKKNAAEYIDSSGRHMIGAYELLEPLHLGLVVETTREQALEPVHSLFAFMAAIAGVMLLFVIALAYFLSAIVLRPLDALLEGAEALRVGNSPFPIRVKTGTELDKLAEMFNSMSASVRAREYKLAERAARDALTGLYNRGRLEEFLELEIRRRRRAGEPVSFVMLDIDHFKDVNDRFGHPAGDEVLRSIGGMLSQAVRGGDVVARYGGEEFAVILDVKSDEEVISFCERIRSLVEKSSFADAGVTIPVTASLGWTRCSAEDCENPDVIRLADRALYDAKNAGRNQAKGSSA